jgi:hypothetical protein
MLPVAVAAGLAGLLFVGRRGPEMPGEMWQPPSSAVSGGVEIEAPPGKNVVVFDVEGRPDIVVVWFFDQGD